MGIVVKWVCCFELVAVRAVRLFSLFLLFGFKDKGPNGLRLGKRSVTSKSFMYMCEDYRDSEFKVVTHVHAESTRQCQTAMHQKSVRGY